MAIFETPVLRSLPPDRSVASMDDATDGDLGALFERVKNGDDEAVKALARGAHVEMRRIASALLHRERHAHAMDPTSLVNEAWVRLLRTCPSPTWENRKTFFTGVATVMKRVLITNGRRRTRARHGAGWVRQPFDPVVEGLAAGTVDLDQVADLHAALESLRRVNARAAHVVDLRMFAVLTIEETALVMDLATSTVEGEFKAARAWLREWLERGDRGP